MYLVVKIRSGEYDSWLPEFAVVELTQKYLDWIREKNKIASKIKDLLSVSFKDEDPNYYMLPDCEIEAAKNVFEGLLQYDLFITGSVNTDALNDMNLLRHPDLTCAHFNSNSFYYRISDGCGIGYSSNIDVSWLLYKSKQFKKEAKGPSCIL